MAAKKKIRRAISKLSQPNQGGWSSREIATFSLWGGVCVSHKRCVCVHMCEQEMKGGRMSDVCGRGWTLKFPQKDWKWSLRCCTRVLPQWQQAWEWKRPCNVFQQPGVKQITPPAWLHPVNEHVWKPSIRPGQPFVLTLKTLELKEICPKKTPLLFSSLFTDPFLGH